MTNQLFLVAHIGEHPIAFASDQVQSVVDLGPITRVPRTGPLVRGLAALRSRVVTVIDPRPALGLDPLDDDGAGPPSSRAVVVTQASHHYAILVDALDDVAEFAPAALDPSIALAPGWAHAARGLIEREGEPILIVDAATLIEPPATDLGTAAAERR